MKALHLLSRKTGVLLLVLLLASLGTVGGGRQSHTAAAAASTKSYVYYVSNDVLYRVTTDGSETQKIAENYDGNGLDSTGKYLYFYYDGAMGIQRLSLSDPDALITNFLGDRNILFTCSTVPICTSLMIQATSTVPWPTLTMIHSLP